MFYKLAQIALLAFGISAAHAETPISGRVYSNVYVPTQSLLTSELQQTDVGLWIQGDPRLSPESWAHFTLSGDTRSYSKTRREATTTSGESNSTSPVAEIREGYAAYAKDSWEFRFGRQIIPWGKSDGINPTDVLGAKDLTYFQPDDEMRRIGALSGQAFYTPTKGASPWTFNLVWTPVFAQTKMLIPKKSVPSGVTVQAIDQPRIALRDTEVAGKISYLGDGWDFSVMSFKGWSHQPEFTEVSRSVSLSGVSVVIRPAFYQMNAYGADLSVSALGTVLRLEAAYKDTANRSGKDPTTIPGYAEAVAGVEKKFFDDYRLQVQGTWRGLQHQMPVSSDAVTKQIASTNQLVLGYQEKNRYGATLRFGYENDDAPWKVEFFVLAYKGDDYYYRPKITYKWSGAFETAVGADHYGGDTKKPLGSLHEFNAAFLDARYFF